MHTSTLPTRISSPRSEHQADHDHRRQPPWWRLQVRKFIETRRESMSGRYPCVVEPHEPCRMHSPSKAYTWSKGQGDLHSWRASSRPSTTGRPGHFMPGASEQLLYIPGVGMAIFATQAKRVTDEMFIGAGQRWRIRCRPTCSSRVSCTRAGSNILETEIQTDRASAKTCFRLRPGRVPRPPTWLRSSRACLHRPAYRTAGQPGSAQSLEDVL